MKIQLLSDLHIEFEAFQYPAVESDIVVLAGDIHIKGRALEWALDTIKDKPVLLVLGNHDYYGKAYPKLVDELKAVANGTNVNLLENDVFTFQGVNFLGCTFWTDFELFGDPRTAGYACQQIMTDFKKIKKAPNYSKIRSIDVAAINKRSKDWLAKTLEERRGETNVVITHHAPSIKSVPTYYREDIATAAYASNLDDFIIKHEPSYWLHGHCHNSSDYQVGSCRVVCNPKGYPGEENPDFGASFCIEINQ